MGLNDEFFTVDADQDQEQKVKVDVFKPTNNGDVPELKEDVDFIAVSYDDLPADEEEQMNNTALEEACVRLRDLELFAIRLREEGGMSQAAALESVAFLPGLITEDHPVGFYTASPTRTSLNYALEEAENEKTSLFTKIITTIRAFFARVGQWFKNFFEKFNFGKKKEELAKREQEQEANRKAMEEKIAALNEEIQNLKRAASTSDESFKEALGEKNQQLADIGKKLQVAQSTVTDTNNQLKAAQGQAAETHTKLQNLQTQMRVLDETKNREIAAALDEMDKLRRREEGSRAARIELQGKIEELGTLVHRSMCREAFDLVQHQEKEIVAEYSGCVASTIAGNELLAKYLFGNGFQNRLQTVKRMTAVILATKPIVVHVQELQQAFKEAEHNPGKLVQVIQGFDFSHFSSPDQVFQKSDGFEEAAKQIQPKQMRAALDEMQKEIATASAALGAVKFEDISKVLEDLNRILTSGVSISANNPNISQVANSYRAFQGHVAKLMPYITAGAVAQRNMMAVWNAAIVAPIDPIAFTRSPVCASRMAGIIKGVSQNISLMESFVNANMRKLIAETIIVTANTAYQ